ncbi:MAG: phosphate ABC transporter permease subunit PstC [Hyphomicrobiaceae bacterium]
MFEFTTLVVLAFTLAAFLFGRTRASSVVGGNLEVLHSLPSYHGLYSALWTFLVGIAALVSFSVIANFWIDSSLMSALPEEARQMSELRQTRLLEDSKALANGQIVSAAADEKTEQWRRGLAETYSNLTDFKNLVVAIVAIALSLLALFVTFRQIAPRFRARNRSEWIIQGVLLVSATLAILTTVGIVLSLIGETLRFFSDVPVYKFLFGTHWSPLSGVFEGKLNADSVGAIPLFAGTLLITFIAMIVAVPIGLLAAIYLSDYASSATRAWAKPLLELLAGIPTVVYGFFAAITVAPIIRGFGESIGLNVASESALAAGIVMGIMIIPFISSLSDDVINSVPQSLRDGSYGLGATKAETITRVILPAALPGIVSAVLLGVSRAIGETMIVVMAAGQGANLTWNPLEAVTTVTVQIVALITGDTEADTAAGPAFALGFTLFCVTLIFNVIALRIVQKYRQRYD